MEPEFVGAISSNIWKQVLQRKLVRELRQSIMQGYEGVCEFLDAYEIVGQCIPYNYIKWQNDALDALKYNRDLAEFAGDPEAYDLLTNEINVANLYPEIMEGLNKLTINA